MDVVHRRVTQNDVSAWFAERPQTTLVSKNQALERYDSGFGGVASTLTGLLLLAGKPELAAKVRPSTRRAGQTAETTDPTPTPPANPAPTS